MYCTLSPYPEIGIELKISWRIIQIQHVSKLFHDYFSGRDVVRKLYALNKRRMNERGYNYDIRLPCIISLKDEVEEREQRRVEAQTSPRRKL